MDKVLKDSERFYRELTLRNSGFITSEEQIRLRKATILVAGCGSTGGAVTELLVRTGAESLLLVDNGKYELNNANRQSMTVADIERNKAEVHLGRVKAINPFCVVECVNEGISSSNVETLVRQSDIVVDGVDVTTREGLRAKYLLHDSAHRNRRPVISGYDLATSQYVVVYDFRDETQEMFDALVTKEMVEALEPLTTCLFLVPPNYLPLELVEDFDKIASGTKDFISQLGIAANLFGVLCVSLILDLLSERPVRHEIYLDVREVTRPDYGINTSTELQLRRAKLKQLSQEAKTRAGL